MLDPKRWQFGAHVRPNGSAVFRIWAPDVASIALELDGAAPRALAAVGDGWFELHTSASAHARYRYVLPDGTRIPDPASRGQDGDVHDASILVDPKEFVWQHPDWRGRPWPETVLYEVHVGLLGGFAGVTAKLSEIAALGVTAIELMPIADFPGPRNWGYDGVLPFAPDLAYGSPDLLRTLVDTAHGLGLSVFLDVVYNHFGPEGNYLSRYASPFFRPDLSTPWGSALDFRRREVRDYFTENVLYWLNDFRLDGLRLDAVHAIADAGWLDGLPATVQDAFGGERFVHLVVENDDNEARLMGAGFAAQWNDDVHHVLHVLLTGETDGYYADYARAPASLLARCLEQGFAYQGEPSLHRGGAPRGSPSRHLSPLSFVAFLQNHDQVGNRAMGERLASLAPREALEAAMALLLLAPWVPMLFMGEDEAKTDPFLYFTSYDGALAEAVREGRRREFARFPAFASEDAQRNIPDPNAPDTFLRSQAQAQAESEGGERPFRSLVQGLLALRHERLVPHFDDFGSAQAEALGPTSVCARWQLSDGLSLVLYSNLGTKSQNVEPAGKAPEDAGLLFESRVKAASMLAEGELAGWTTIAFLVPAQSTGSTSSEEFRA